MWLYRRVLSPKDADRMANSVDPEQSDLGLHCLPRHICPKTWDHYGNTQSFLSEVSLTLWRKNPLWTKTIFSFSHGTSCIVHGNWSTHSINSAQVGKVVLCSFSWLLFVPLPLTKLCIPKVCSELHCVGGANRALMDSSIVWLCNCKILMSPALALVQGLKVSMVCHSD